MIFLFSYAYVLFMSQCRTAKLLPSFLIAWLEVFDIKCLVINWLLRVLLAELHFVDVLQKRRR